MTLRFGSGAAVVSAFVAVGEVGRKSGERTPESLLVTKEVDAVSLSVSMLDVTASAICTQGCQCEI